MWSVVICSKSLASQGRPCQLRGGNLNENKAYKELSWARGDFWVKAQGANWVKDILAKLYLGRGRWTTHVMTNPPAN